MNRPITLATGQWGDLPLEELCELTGSLGFDGLEIAVSESVLSIEKAASSKEYCEERLEILHSHGLKMWAICAALAGQCVGDLYDPRLDNFAPARFAGKPEGFRRYFFAFSVCTVVSLLFMGLLVSLAAASRAALASSAALILASISGVR